MRRDVCAAAGWKIGAEARKDGGKVTTSKGSGQMDYSEFLNRKTQVGCDSGFDPVWMPDMLFPFQKALVEWATRKGRDRKSTRLNSSHAD